MFRSHIVPAIVALWGVAIVLRLLLGGTEGSGAYSAGQVLAGILAVVMVVVGVRALLNARTASSRR